MAYIVFRFPTSNSKRKARSTRHHARADVRISSPVETTAQALALRDRLNGRGYIGRAYQVDVMDDGSVVTAGGMRIRVTSNK